ncbi:translation initiation factor IF-2-like isoform X2 [Paramacrobiotus metropolitanus]|uniref:translation initiation factor IF-2-like isoform X2 n=1 Tax=Paramacrobiotus metropolitanus TaxID=2943436 RepID=UPI0024463550|nr:translation initiation factor IF-2-like isoform X2 [Paramacrobiotus metropolitanus]
MGATSSKRKGTFDVQKGGKTANGAGVVAQSTDAKTTVQHVVKEDNGIDKGVQEAIMGNGTSGRSASLRFIDADGPGENEAQKGERSHSIPIQLHQSPANLVQPTDPAPTRPLPASEPLKEVVANGYKAHPEPEVVFRQESAPAPAAPVLPAPPAPSPQPGLAEEKKPGTPAAPASHVHAQGDAADLTVTIENIEEVSLSKRGSYVATGERVTLEVPEYAVSEPDSDLEVRELTNAEIAAEEKRRAEERPEVTRAESPVGLVDEPKTGATPIVETKSSADLVEKDTDEEDLVSTMQEIEWTEDGDVVFVRGTFSNWDKKPMEKLEKGGFAYTFPVNEGTVYMYNFVVDDAVRTASNKETTKYYVGDNEEVVHTLCVMD